MNIHFMYMYNNNHLPEKMAIVSISSADNIQCTVIYMFLHATNGSGRELNKASCFQSCLYTLILPSLSTLHKHVYYNITYLTLDSYTLPKLLDGCMRGSGMRHRLVANMHKFCAHVRTSSKLVAKLPHLTPTELHLSGMHTYVILCVYVYVLIL